MVPPQPGADGRVPFGALHWGKTPPGILTVTADRPGVYVFLEGRFFGVTPLSISQVPTGDYVVEATYPDGRTVTRPVSVREGQEERLFITATVLQTAAAPDRSRSWVSRVGKPAWIVAGIGVAALAAGGVTAYLEGKKQDEYDHAPLVTPADQKHLTDLAQEGRRLALFTNIFVGAGAACLITAGILAVRDVKRSASETPGLSLIVAPGADSPSLAASFSLRF